MSFSCPKCPKRLSTRQRLDTHLEKTVPCDLQCRECPFKATTRKQYDNHIRKPHPLIVNTDEDEDSSEAVEIRPEINKVHVRLPGDPPRDSDIIPLQDFDKNFMDMLIDYANENNAEVKVKMLEITVKPLKQRAVNALKVSDYANSLECLDNDKNVNDTAIKVLSQIHGDAGRPEMHSIRLTDFVRRNVSIYTRSTEDSEAEWLPFAKAAALHMLSKHVSKILNFTLMKATSSLEWKFCEQDKVVCYCLYDPDNKRNVIIVDSDPDGMLASWGYAPQLEVKFYEGNIIDIPESLVYLDQVRRLGVLIQEKAVHVLSQLENLVLTEKDVMPFLEQTRRPLLIKH